MCDVLDRVEEKGKIEAAKALKVTEDVVKSWLGLQLA